MKLRLAAPKMKVADVYPEFQPLAKAAKSGDWAAVRAEIAALPPDNDLTFPIVVVTDVPKSELFLEQALSTDRDSHLPRIMLASRYVQLGWQARTGYRAHQVSRDQFAVFHDYLHKADRLLADVVGDEPGNAAAWSFRVTLARGLELGIPETRRRYDKIAELSPHCIYAQRQMVQQLCPKWGGTWEGVRSFVAGCVTAAGPGALSGALVVDGHIEYANAEWGGEARQAAYFQMPSVQAELDQAAMRSVFNPAYRPVPGWVWAHNVFAFAHWRAGLYPKSLVHFTILDDRASPHPWETVGSPAGDMFLGARNRSLRRAK